MGTIFREQPFTDGHKAMELFINLSQTTFPDKLEELDRLTTEVGLHNLVDMNQNESVYIGEASLIFMWAPCDSKCTALGLWN